jgi:hypothetical protein
VCAIAEAMAEVGIDITDKKPKILTPDDSAGPTPASRWAAATGPATRDRESR